MNRKEKNEILLYLISKLDCCNKCPYRHGIGDSKFCFFASKCMTIQEELEDIFNAIQNGD